MRVVHVLRKPLEKKLAFNVLMHGCGPLHVDAVRIQSDIPVSSVHAVRQSDYPESYDRTPGGRPGWGRSRGGLAGDEVHWEPNPNGRWPPNVILQHQPGCGSQCVCTCPVAVLGEQLGNEGFAVARFFKQVKENEGK